MKEQAEKLLVECADCEWLGLEEDLVLVDGRYQHLRYGGYTNDCTCNKFYIVDSDDGQGDELVYKPYTLAE